jgi:hypothetical protein
VGPPLKAAGHVGLSSTDDEVVMARARDVDTLPAELAALLLDATSLDLKQLLVDEAIAKLMPDKVRVRPLPLRGVRGG